MDKHGLSFILGTIAQKYSYNFTALGRPIIQYPQDMVAVQELIWRVRPDLVVETGIAHGGSLVMSAAMLALLDYCDAAFKGETVDPAKPSRKVVGVDIELRPHNRKAVEEHPLASRIEMLEGSSIDDDIVRTIRDRAASAERILVMLDSNHTHAHVLGELEAYAPLVSPGSYCIVFDTIVEYLPAGSFPDRPWGIGDSPHTAVIEYLKTHPEFVIDREIDAKLLLSVAPEGYLRRVA